MMMKSEHQCIRKGENCYQMKLNNHQGNKAQFRKILSTFSMEINQKMIINELWGNEKLLSS